MNILDELAAFARVRVQKKKKQVPLAKLQEQVEKRMDGQDRDFPFEQALRKETESGDSIHFICECKKASPSKGLIAPDFPYLSIAKEYESAGASALSVLTEPKWFLGSDAYLRDIAQTVSLPCIRKDFTVDPYMIYEAKILGASCVLLICAILSDKELRDYIALVDSLGLSALVEAHDEKEVKRAVQAGARIIGVNNRNLKDFTVDIHNSERLRRFAPKDTLFVAESGIRTARDVQVLRACGVNAVLIGETLMRAPDKRKALQELGKKEALIKVCGLRTKEDVRAVNETEPDLAGFIFAKDRERYVAPEVARELKKQLKASIRAVGVFVDEPLDSLVKTIRTVGLDLVQLHGHEDEAYIKELRKRAGKGVGIIKAFPVHDEADVKRAQGSSADFLLFDTGAGGTGQVFDWSVLRSVKRPYMLAGGIGPDNVAEAIRQTKAFAIDASSALETNGHKDADKVRRFVQTARDASRDYR